MHLPPPLGRDNSRLHSCDTLQAMIDYRDGSFALEDDDDGSARTLVESEEEVRQTARSNSSILSIWPSHAAA